MPAKAFRILIVTDNNIVTKTPVLESIRSHLDGRQVFLFQDVRENPNFSNVEDGGRIARNVGAELVIGVGGGSSMDTAKGIALLAVNHHDLHDYLRGEPLLNHPLPVICIPTTSGSGSEATPYVVFTDLEDKNKIGYANPGLFPIVSIIDPELTYSMPEAVVVNTGLDALTHALESYLSTESFAMNDMLALHVMEVVLENIKAAARKDTVAMDSMAYAAMLAGIVITNCGTILLHIMGYCLTMYHGVSHGRASAALLPAVLDYLRNHSPAKDKIKKLDELFTPRGGVRAFIEDLGVSTRLSSYGVLPEELENYVQKVIVKSDIRVTPAQVTSQDIFRIYQSTL